MGVGVFFLFLGIHRNIRMDMVSKILNISNFENLIATSVPKSLDLFTPPPLGGSYSTQYLENECCLHWYCTCKNNNNKNDIPWKQMLPAWTLHWKNKITENIYYKDGCCLHKYCALTLTTTKIVHFILVYIPQI